MTLRSAAFLCLSLFLSISSIGACGGGLMGCTTGTGGMSGAGGAAADAGSCPVDIYPGASCQTGHGCPVDPYGNGADVVLPAMCACHVETNPQQGESYCVCSVPAADAGSGG